jgi:hypothetical protein
MYDPEWEPVLPATVMRCGRVNISVMLLYTPKRQGRKEMKKISESPINSNLFGGTH